MRDMPDLLFHDIDSLVDEALADPSRAPFVKATIRSRLSRLTPSAPSSPDAATDDADDLWDNVPL